MVNGGRRTDAIAVTLILNREARQILVDECGGRIIGKFVDRLLFEHRARKEERQRILAQARTTVPDEA